MIIYRERERKKSDGVIIEAESVGSEPNRIGEDGLKTIDKLEEGRAGQGRAGQGRAGKPASQPASHPASHSQSYANTHVHVDLIAQFQEKHAHSHRGRLEELVARTSASRFLSLLTPLVLLQFFFPRKTKVRQSHSPPPQPTTKPL